jgi:hypothetical protein
MSINIAKYKSNINHCPKIYYDREQNDQGDPIDGGDLTMAIELNAPAEFYELGFCEKLKKEKFFRIISPFKMQNDSTEGFGHEQSCAGDLLNYWNLKQVIYIKGSQDAAFDAEQVFDQLIEQERISCFKSMQDEEMKDNYDFSIMERAANESDE